MTQEIESVKPALTVILDDGDFIINSIGPIGKLMAQAILPAAAAARKVTIITDGEMKVLKRNGSSSGAIASGSAALAAAQQKFATSEKALQRAVAVDLASGLNTSGPDIQDQFAADLEAGVTGEIATGEVPAPTPGPNAPTPTPVAPAPGRRKPQIFQDAAAPPAPELAEAEMDRLLQEAAQAERDQAKVAEERRFQAQQAVQDGDESVPAKDDPKHTPRKREPRNLATTGRPCGRCGGNGQVMGDAGFTGHCPVCMGAGQVKTWDRAIRR